ncbi:MAG: hypothetical protein L6R36_002373 [Xanthoria steineri]|nr:MAG: hypothetical protein L6R36_002373 [Xanthoria steineri]
MTATTQIPSPVPSHRSQLLRPHRPRFSSSSEEDGGQRTPNAEDLGPMRAESYTTGPRDRHASSHKNMAERPTPRRTSSGRISSSRASDFTAQGVRPGRLSGHHHHRRRRSRAQEHDIGPDPVYVYHANSTGPEPPRLRRSKTTNTASTSQPKKVRRTSDTTARSHTERRKSRHSKDEIAVQRIVRPKYQPKPENPYKGYRSRPSVARSASTRETASITPSRPSLLRSQTTTRKTRPPPSITLFSPTITEPAPSVASRSRRSSGFFGSILGIPRDPPAPEKRVECLTCLSSYPVSRTAHLACNHRMCHACLRRIFTLSVSDPQHMPPKCCTADHIPLKHVERLFDLKFKKKWNLKYQEYTTKNRLYCPARGCGEWIKPANIHVDTTGGANAGKKYGKCGRCRTRVCVACNGRWHASRTCPRDDATKQFIEIAKKEGWQRCYNCSATVELKEGCNHMTCRCKAEFCMICGVKWKGCDCPWFNYQTVEQDRLNHMNVPVIRRIVVDGQEVGADHPRAARGYQAELDARREQERRDEQLARRLQTLGLDPPGVEIYQVGDDDHNSNNHGFRVSDTAGHHMAMHFVPPAAPLNMPSIPYNSPRQAQPTYPSVPQMQPQPLLRQHSQASRTYNNHRTTRAAERLVPGRSTTDYEHEAAVHAPLRSATVGLGGEQPRGSALAGLTRGGTAEGRVDEWRRWVDVG